VERVFRRFILEGGDGHAPLAAACNSPMARRPGKGRQGVEERDVTAGPHPMVTLSHRKTAIRTPCCVPALAMTDWSLP